MEDSARGARRQIGPAADVDDRETVNRRDDHRGDGLPIGGLVNRKMRLDPCQEAGQHRFCDGGERGFAAACRCNHLNP